MIRAAGEKIRTKAATAAATKKLIVVIVVVIVVVIWKLLVYACQAVILET